MATGLPGFRDGVRRGFHEALRIIHEQHLEDIRAKPLNRLPLSRWSAVVLYRACHQAFGRLRLSDRVGAMNILKRAMARVDVRRIRLTAR